MIKLIPTAGVVSSLSV